MWDIRRYLVYSMLVAAAGPGCQVVAPYRPLPVLVRDAETKKPIEGAVARAFYPLARGPLTPPELRRVTDEDGIADLRASPLENGCVRIEAVAPGYLPGEKLLDADAVRALEPLRPFEAADSRPASVTVDLYAEPRPAVELVVPTGYRGELRVEIDARDDAPVSPGQRVFRVSVSPKGTARVTGPAILRRVFPTDIRACYADGTPLSPLAKDAAQGFWWVRSEGKSQCFLVGRKDEFDALRRSYQPPDGDGSGTGRGRPGRNGIAGAS